MEVALKNSVEGVVEVPLQPLTAEAFRPYGIVLDMSTPIYPEMDAGTPVIYLTKMRRKPGRQQIRQMAMHFTYTQFFTVLQGSLALIVAPPPRNREAPVEDYEFDYDRVAAFIVEAGTTVDVARGVWHSGLALGEEVLSMTGSRADVSKAEFKARSDVVGGSDHDNAEQRRMQPSIEHVNLLKRDNRLLEIVL